MKKVIYLNYDLSKPEDLMCYNFLISLGRTKKSFVNTVLMSTRLPQNYAVSGMYNGMIPEKVEGKKLKNIQDKNSQAEVKREFRVMESPPMANAEIRNVEQGEAVQLIWPEETDRTVSNAPDISKAENPYPMFTLEQLERIREKGLDLDALTVGQKKAMARMMADYVPAATAYSLAGFEE